MTEPNANAEKNRDEINAAYVEAHAFVIHYLDEIDGRTHDLPAPESDEVDWEHVAVMSKVMRDLREIVVYLVSYGDLED